METNWSNNGKGWKKWWLLVTAPPRPRNKKERGTNPFARIGPKSCTHGVPLIRSVPLTLTNKPPLGDKSEGVVFVGIFIDFDYLLQTQSVSRPVDISRFRHCLTFSSTHMLLCCRSVWEWSGPIPDLFRPILDHVG